MAEAPLWDQETEPWGGRGGLAYKAERAEPCSSRQSEPFRPLILGLH